MIIRVVKYVPEISGCYGPRLWVSATDKELNCVLKVLSIWGGATGSHGTNSSSQELCYELPFGFTSTDIWHNFIERMNISFMEF